MTTEDDLKTALDLLREAKAQLIGDIEEMIDEFIDKMEQPVVTIKPDTDPPNPRTEYDNVDVMFCKHRRYNLGDEDAEDPFEEIMAYDLGGYEISGQRFEDVVNMLDDWCLMVQQDEGGGSSDSLRAESAYRWMTGQEGCFEDERIEHGLRPGIAICLPLGLYDHSGITIFHGTRSAFDSAGWDSGQVGWHYMTKDAVEREFGGDLGKAEAYMESTLHTYDQYLRGDVWGYTIETRSGEPIDSCWGFYGDELEETGMLGNVEEKYREALKEAWERRFER